MYVFTNNAALVAATLNAGQLVATKGGTTAGDGAGGIYLIQTPADFGGTPNETTDLTIDNGYVAVLQRRISIEGYSDEGAVSGSVTLDCEGGAFTTFEFSTSAEITNVTIDNIPDSPGTVFGIIIIIEIASTPDTISFGSEFDWSGGSAPAFDTADTKEVVVAFTVDGGTTWLASVAMTGLSV